MQQTVAEITNKYADYLTAQGYVYSMAPNNICLLHAPSNYQTHVSEFTIGFPAWAKSNDCLVPKADYADFLKALPDKLLRKIPRVVGRGMRPTAERVYLSRRGAKLANTFRPYTPIVPTKFSMHPILQEYLDRAFANEQDRKIVVQFMADIIQNPTQRPQWGLILTGVQGSGKSTVIELVKIALGGNYVWSGNSYTPIFEKFSESLPDNMLVCFDDAPGKADVYEKLKRAITCSEVEVEIKGQQNRVEREVYARVVICSNSPRPLRLESGDRRFYCAAPSTHRISPEETAEFFERFITWKDENPLAIYHWLRSVDLSDFVRGSCIKTATHATMIDMSISVLDDAIAGFVEDLNGKAFHPNTLYDHLSALGIPCNAVDLIKAALAKVGYETSRRRIKGIEGQISIYQQATIGKAAPLSDSEIDSISAARNCNSFL